MRDSVAEELRTNPPDLLVLCPPCTDEGGWFNLNACHMDPRNILEGFVVVACSFDFVLAFMNNKLQLVDKCCLSIQKDQDYGHIPKSKD